ncbi:CsbD family protein [Microtetraspora malaysiensis]|uniref:CsbD family protein n=1 Tax=Microtetraspora malaysiensis TaxID=161358 RepID=A0ABW6T2I9_9ACTN
MGKRDKVSNKAQELKGKAKERVGEMTDDKRKEAEGKADKVKGNIKQAGEKVKDAFKD